MAEWDCRFIHPVHVNKGPHCFTAKPGVRRAIEALPDRENGTYLVTVGRNADLNKAMDDASWDMINLLEKDKKLTRLDAYALASMVMDCRVAAPRGIEKAVHCLVPKSTWGTARGGSEVHGCAPHRGRSRHRSGWRGRDWPRLKARRHD